MAKNIINYINYQHNKNYNQLTMAIVNIYYN